MENKINIAELLKDCPQGMELDCILFNKPIKYGGLCNNDSYPIKILTENDGYFHLTKEGYLYKIPNSKCVIFPKSKTTWDGFVPPCKFKDGDILATDLGSVFFLNTRLNTDEYYGCFVGKGGDGSFHICEPFAYKECCGLATEEEKQKLFQAIKDNGYKWNEETKTLEKLIEPKFKVGDKIENLGYRFTIIQVKDNNYLTKCGKKIPIDNQDNFTLVPNKFDFTTLKPFESKVLIRDTVTEIWYPAFWGFYDKKSSYPYKVIGGMYRYCIPYKSNEYLLGTTEDCDNFFKNW